MMVDELAELLDGLEVTGIRPVGGGDINQAVRVETPDGPMFAKFNRDPGPDMFAREASGLRMLARYAPGSIGVPSVLRETAHGLLLEWIEPGRGIRETEAEFGRGLAGLHKTTIDHFGALDDGLAGYLGSVGIDLTPTDDWVEFFVWRRVRPLAERAVSEGALSSDALRLLDALEPRFEELCGPPEPPALLHGDLWAGNRMIDASGRNWLIDPAAHWGHRESDLAMMRLFGGFGADAFAAYDEALPLADGWQERVRWYQLPPLLVHAILFGGAYGSSVVGVLRSYA